MNDSDTTIASKYPHEAKWLRLMLLINILLLAVGLLYPIIPLKHFVSIEYTFSVFSGAIGLVKEEHL